MTAPAHAAQGAPAPAPGPHPYEPPATLAGRPSGWPPSPAPAAPADDAAAPPPAPTTTDPGTYEDRLPYGLGS